MNLNRGWKKKVGKKLKDSLQKAALAISDGAAYRRGCIEGGGLFPDTWLASIPKVFWCWSKDLSCDHSAFCRFKEIVHVRARLRPCWDPSAERCLNTGAVANYTSRSYWNASVCSSTADFHKTRGKKGQIGEERGQLSSFQHSVFRFSCSFPPSTFRERPTRTKNDTKT